VTIRSDILLVEDDPDEVTVALRALARTALRASVDVARDGLEAIEALGLGRNGALARRPRVVFLDLKMPRMDGFEVLEQIRADPRMADIPVVVVSSSDRRQDIARSYELGANSFLLKRFDRQSPGRYFAEAARYWLDWNRTARHGG